MIYKTQINIYHEIYRYRYGCDKKKKEKKIFKITPKKRILISEK